MKVLKNQLVMKEGVLPYWEKGRLIKKLKRWKDLLKFVDKKIPVTDGHPEEGIVTPDTKIYGYGTYKVCKLKEKSLCVDFELNDDAPKRDGYSSGYIFEPIEELGKFEDQDYDMIQNLILPDHIALTNLPRLSEAVATDSKVLCQKFGICGMISTDSRESRDSKVVLNKYAYDSIIPFKIKNDLEINQKNSIEIEKKMPKELDTITAENKKLLEELAALKASKAAGDEYQKAIDAEKAEKAKLKRENDALKAEFDALKAEKDAMEKAELEKRNKKAIAGKDSIVKTGVDSKIFNGKSLEQLEAMIELWGALPKSNALISEKVKKEGDSETFRVAGLDFVYDEKSNSMVPREKLLSEVAYGGRR